MLAPAARTLLRYSRAAILSRGLSEAWQGASCSYGNAATEAAPSSSGAEGAQHAAGSSSKTQQHPGVGEPLAHLEKTGCIYLDYNATTPVFPEVAEAMVPFLFQHFGNPSSNHVYGRTCKAAIDKARSQVAGLLNTTPSQLCFTSCGTESDHWAIYGSVMAKRASLAGAAGGVVPHVVASQIEHPAVLAYLAHLQAQGLCTYTLVPVTSEGLVVPEAVESAIQPHTALVTAMHSNNEIGSIQPIAAIAAIARSKGVLMHSDAAQSIGKVPVDVQALGVDMLTVVGHKFGAPKGVGALYIREGVSIPNFFHGGGQEGGRRAGTESVPLLVGLGKAAEIASQEGVATALHMRAMRQRLFEAIRGQLKLREEQSKLAVNGPADDRLRLPNTLSLSIQGLDSAEALSRLSSHMAASAGAACHSHAGPSVSAVLKAIQAPLDFARGTLRLSTGRHTTPAHMDRAADLIVSEARRQGVLS